MSKTYFGLLSAQLNNGGTPSMTVGINCGVPTYYAPPMFANAMYRHGGWQAVDGSGNTGTRTVGVSGWSDDQGILVGDGGQSGATNVFFRGHLVATDYGLPAGTYTILNPSAQEIAIGTFSNPQAYVAWTQTTQTTFNYASTGSNGMFIWVRASAANPTASHLMPSGALAIILPGLLSSWQSGNVWNPDFLAFDAALGTKSRRWMQATNTNGNYEADWADRSVPTKITLRSRKFGTRVPHEFIIDHANRTGVRPWINLSAYSTSDYWAQCAALYAATLRSDLQVLPELSNENWNYAADYGNNTNYIAYLHQTKFIATMNQGANSFTRAGHGLSTNNTVVLFTNPSNNQLISNNTAYDLQNGYSYKVNVLDANTFTLQPNGGGTKSLAAYTGMANILYCKEDGTTGSKLDENYANMLVGIWNAFDSAFVGYGGAGRVVHSVGSQAANPTHTFNRLQNATLAAKADSVHVAPYFNGSQFGCQSTAAAGQLTITGWFANSSYVYAALYPQGATPTRAAIALGTGAVQTLPPVTIDSSASQITQTLGTFTGLTDGTQYSVWLLIFDGADTTGKSWLLGGGTHVSGAGGAIVSVVDSNANAAARSRINAWANTMNTTNGTPAHAAQALASAGRSIKIISYEGGPDFGGYKQNNLPGYLSNWFLDSYVVSPEYAAALKTYYYDLAASGMREHNYYADSFGGGSIFHQGSASLYDLIPNADYNARDSRFNAIASFGGKVPKKKPVSLPNLTPPILSAAPSYPYTIATLPTGYTYTLLTGDWYSNFAINGNLLQMVNGTGIDFNAYASLKLFIEATDGFTNGYFTANVTVGGAWYEGDANFVFDSIVDTDTTTLDPPSVFPLTNFGQSLPIITGTGAVRDASGMWDLTGTVYYNTTAMLQTLDLTKPILVMVVVDAYNQSQSFVYYLGVGAGSSVIGFGNNGPTAPIWQVNLASSTTNGVTIPAVSQTLSAAAAYPASGTKSVFWVYIDPNDAVATIRTGMNLTVKTTKQLAIPTGLLSKNLEVGNWNGGTTSKAACKFGGIQVVNRAALTFGTMTPGSPAPDHTTAAGMVAQLMARHGIVG